MQSESKNLQLGNWLEIIDVFRSFELNVTTIAITQNLMEKDLT